MIQGLLNALTESKSIQIRKQLSSPRINFTRHHNQDVSDVRHIWRPNWRMLVYSVRRTIHLCPWILRYVELALIWICCLEKLETIKYKDEQRMGQCWSWLMQSELCWITQQSKSTKQHNCRGGVKKHSIDWKLVFAGGNKKRSCLKILFDKRTKTPYPRGAINT